MIHALNSKLMHIFLQTVNKGRKALPANTNGESERKKGLAQRNNVIREPGPNENNNTVSCKQEKT